VGSAGALWLAADFGWHYAYSAMAVLMAAGIVTTLLVREPAPQSRTRAAVEGRTGENVSNVEPRVVDWLRRHAHWPRWLRSSGAWILGAVICPVLDFFTRFGWRLGLLIFAFIGSYRLTDYAMGVMTNPFYLDHGYTLKEVAAVVKGFGLVASIVGVLAGGTVVARLGMTRALILGSVMVMLSNLGFAVLASTPTATLTGLALVNSFDNLALGIHGTALVAFLSSLTSANYTATQYAVLSSLYAMPGKLLMGTSGFVVDAVGYPTFFVYTAALSLPGLLLLYWLVRKPPTQSKRSSEGVGHSENPLASARSR
jgi:PAT family beta-lactamase induction signal transducer AmpG